MTLIYQIAHHETQTDREFTDKAEAMNVAEVLVDAFGSQAEMTTWNRHPNIPGCKPDMVDSCCSLRIYESGDWRIFNIH